MKSPNFFADLKRRNVIRAALLYVGAVWALAQGISQLGRATRWFLVAAAIGFPFWIAFAWFYEFTPQALKRESEIDPFWRTYSLALAEFANGNRTEADAALKKLIDENADNAGSQIASVYALRNEPEKMFECLEQGWATHDTKLSTLLHDPFLIAYKDDPRFIAFAQKTRRHAENRRQMNDFFSEQPFSTKYAVSTSGSSV